MVNGLKEAIEAWGDRLKNRIIGSIIASWFVINWKLTLVLLFGPPSNSAYVTRTGFAFDYIDSQSCISLFWLPALIGLFYWGISILLQRIDHRARASLILEKELFESRLNMIRLIRDNVTKDPKQFITLLGRSFANLKSVSEIQVMNVEAALEELGKEDKEKAEKIGLKVFEREEINKAFSELEKVLYFSGIEFKANTAGDLWARIQEALSQIRNIIYRKQDR